ncbi:Helix-turn-helix [Terrisporobacter glycolicus]|nr:Helix-turn-helix [Terrisporobacter glycolicus]
MNINKELGLNIKKIRQSKGISRKELANILGCSIYAIEKYEQGQRTPSIDILMSIAQTLDCTIDDFTEIKSPKIIGENIKKYREINDMSKNTLSYLIDCDLQDIDSYEEGLILPEDKVLEKIARFLNVSLEVLNGKKIKLNDINGNLNIIDENNNDRVDYLEEKFKIFSGLLQYLGLGVVITKSECEEDLLCLYDSRDGYKGIITLNEFFIFADKIIRHTDTEINLLKNLANNHSDRWQYFNKKQ